MILGNFGVQTQKQSITNIIDLNPMMWSFTPFNYVSSGFTYMAAFSQLKIKTSSVAMTLTGGANYNGIQFEFTIYVNGLFNQYVSYSSDTLNIAVDKAITLPTGVKEVTIINSTRQISGSTIYGNFLTRVTATDGLDIERITPKNGDNRTVYLGDSISVSQTSNHPFTGGTIGYMRSSSAYNKSIASYGYGSLELFDLVGTQQKMTTVINNLVSYYSNAVGEISLIIQLSTNDYGHNVISASDFQVLYSTFLDQLIAVLPILKITCVTAFPRTSESANGLGSTLENYRTAIRNSVSGRSYVTSIEGPSIVNTTNLQGDGIHYNDAGYQQIALGLIKSQMNIPDAIPYGQYLSTSANSTGFVTIPSSSNIALGGRNDWTVSIKARRTREGVNDWFFCQGNTNALGKIFWFGSGLANRILVNFSGGLVLTSQVAIIDQKWHTYHVVKSGLTIILYQDGVNVGTLAMSVDFTGTSDSYVGKVLTVYGQVNVDDLRIFDISLTAQQVKEDINTVTPTNFTNILAAYNFDNQVNDISGKGNNGAKGTSATYINA